MATDLGALATLACQRGTKTAQKREACGCPTCSARLALFGKKNLGIPEQELRRSAVAQGVVPDLKHEVPKGFLG